MISDQIVRDEVLDVTKSYLVQAPAGSGKTSLLVQRFLCALAIAKQGPEEIVAITFTRKAAAEMRDRIIAALELGMDPQQPNNTYDAGLWSIARKVLQRDRQSGWQILNNPARLKIMTIDSLCASITKRMPILSRFGAQPKIETQPETLYSQAVDQFLVTIDQDVPWHDALFKILGYLDNDRSKVKKLLVRMLQIREQWLGNLAANLLNQNMRQELEIGLELAVSESLERLIELVPQELNFTILGCLEPQDIDDWLKIAAQLLTATGAWRRTVTAKEGFAPPSASKNKEEKLQLQARKNAMLEMLGKLSNYEAFRVQLDALRILPPVNYDEQQWQIVASLTTVLPILAAQLTLVFRDVGQVDFTEVALAASNALADQNAPTELALELDCKIQHVLVDEFQDTSHTQFKLLEQLTNSWEPNDGKSLFLVGDPMQSIYRFRQAEVGLFLKAKHNGIGNVNLVFKQLTVNFRSSASVINWVNQVFTHSFPKADDMTLGAISYMPAQAANVGLAPYVAVNCLAVAPDSEALQIIEIIKASRAQNPMCSIAILVRAKSHLNGVLSTLRQHSISFQGVDIESLDERSLVQDLLALTKALLHLDDRIAWLAILRAPWCGITLKEMDDLSTGDFTIWQKLQQSESPRLRRITAVMSHAIQQLGRETIDVNVRATWEALGGPQCLVAPAAVLEAEAFFKMLASVNTRREIYATGFLEAQLQKLFLQNPTVDPLAVQIMTMHKSKGLEFDVVILPSLDKYTRNNDQQLLLLERRNFKQEYLLLAAIRAASIKADPIYDYLDWCEKQRQGYETLRLFYVAATRAKQYIYCLTAVSEQAPNDASMLGKIWPAVANQFTNIEQNTFKSIDKERSLKRFPDTWFAENLYEPKVLNSVDIELKSWQQDWVRLAGIVLHRIFWHITTKGVVNQNPEMWQQHLRQLGLPAEYMARAIDIIQQAVSSCLEDPLGAKFLSANHKESHAEWRLTRRVADDFEDVVLDRAFLDHDNIFWLVDYKLVHDANDISAAISEYTPQLYKYRQFLASIRPKTKIKAGLYFPLQKYWHLV
jgi:ATP-dependent exoDNAse (exonuclease V) beta subunit